ncbi:hypothetical protein [Mesorhizobium sp. M0500]|uniref:hypothetical protein n=1 Tax=unclassified Mesorhizobium TaxID=325217 RepID=UPI00333AB863
MNFDVVDIKLLRDHSTELAQFGPSSLDLGIAPNMQVTDDKIGYWLSPRFPRAEARHRA